MKTVREQFEEIWPAPEGVVWCSTTCEYWYRTAWSEPTKSAAEYNARLDTFTRCQESQAIVTSLNDELVEALDGLIKFGVLVTDCPAHLHVNDHPIAIAYAAIAKARGQS
jgi:hypothetical protein